MGMSEMLVAVSENPMWQSEGKLGAISQSNHKNIKISFGQLRVKIHGSLQNAR
jgi:hypothetical protein